MYEVNTRLQDKVLHSLIDDLAPDLRSIETFDGKPRVREFYAMTAERAYEILKAIASISGTTDRLKLMKPEGHEVADEQLAEQIDSSISTYTEEYHLSKGSEFTNKLYYQLKQRILELGNISLEYKKYYVAFKSVTNISDIQLQKKKLKVFINLKKGELKDQKKIAQDYSEIGHWGNGDYLVELDNIEDIDYLIMLVKQAYDSKISC